MKKFNRFVSEVGRFNRVKVRRSDRRDLHALLLLDELFPGRSPLISTAVTDVVYLDLSSEQIESLTSDQALELSRCGVIYEDGYLALLI